LDAASGCAFGCVLLTRWAGVCVCRRCLRARPGLQVTIPPWHSTLVSMITILCGRSAGVMVQGPMVGFEEEELLPVRE
jgi:hypothetical protein